jgi:hypothetical protein
LRFSKQWRGSSWVDLFARDLIPLSSPGKGCFVDVEPDPAHVPPLAHCDSAEKQLDDLKGVLAAAERFTRALDDGREHPERV